AGARAALPRADSGPCSVSCGAGGPGGSPAWIRPAAASRALMDTVWRAAGMVTRSGGVTGPGSGTGPDGRTDRGGGADGQHRAREGTQVHGVLADLGDDHEHEDGVD